MNTRIDWAPSEDDRPQFHDGLGPGRRIVRPLAGKAVLELFGEYDLDAREKLHEVLGTLIEHNDLVVVDVTEAAFIDSSVIHALMAAHREAASRGHRMRLQLGTKAIVRKVIEISGLLDELECAETRPEALA